MTALRIHPEVVDALNAGRAVVALETAVLTHGLPRIARPAPPCCAEYLAGRRHWNAAEPANLELARAMSAVVRGAGAVPAMIGMIRGELVAGLSDDELIALGQSTDAVKLSSRDLAIAHAKRENGGTTVAGTLTAMGLANAQLAKIHSAKAMRVFATGGIGGVHRAWTVRPDASADLVTLARTPVCVVSAGAKSILDLPATVEALETLGVPVLGLGTRWFPRFLTEGASPLAVQREVRSVREAASICTAHWNTFGFVSGILLANPPPARWSLPFETTEALIEDLVQEARSCDVLVGDVTPFLLAGLAARTEGRSVDANVAALLNNAIVAAHLATELAENPT